MYLEKIVTIPPSAAILLELLPLETTKMFMKHGIFEIMKLSSILIACCKNLLSVIACL